MKREEIKQLSVTALCCGFGILTSCSTDTKKVQESIPSTKDSIVVNDEVGRIALTVEHPADTTSALSLTITEYLSETLGGTFSGSYSSPNEVMAYYHADTYKNMKEEYDNIKNIREGDWKLLWNATLSKQAETDKYITYSYQCENYLGGAHGMHILAGITIRKSDCRRMGWEILRNWQNEKMQNLMRQGLKAYFNVKTDEELKPMLFKEEYIYSLPLPQCPPLFTHEGIEFVYNSYEIAPYAAGKPTFTIPYAELKDFMTVTAKQLANCCK